MANGNGDLGERIAALEVNMQIALTGVSNFRQFQVDARKFFERHEERELAREQADALKKEQEEKKDRRRAAIHYWWLGLLSALIVAGFTVVLTQFFQLKAEHHISETQQQSSSYIPQDATRWQQGGLMGNQPDPGQNPAGPPPPDPQPCAFEVPAPKGDDGPLPEKDDEQA